MAVVIFANMYVVLSLGYRIRVLKCKHGASLICIYFILNTLDIIIFILAAYDWYILDFETGFNKQTNVT
jgi:hypothetical protein